MAELLVERLAPVAVVVGADFRFGHHASGDVDTLRELGERYGFTVDAVGLVGRDGARAWSSTAVRQMLAEGDIDGAAERWRGRIGSRAGSCTVTIAAASSDSRPPTWTWTTGPRCPPTGCTRAGWRVDE